MKRDNATPADGPRFLCDAMLGSLARWLRLFGYDALYPAPGVEDRELARRAREEGRWLLTKDRELASAGPRTMLIRAEDLEKQLGEVFGRLDLRPAANLDHARCGDCNGCLHAVSRDEVAEVAPPYVLKTAPRFHRCDGCGRVYWPGSHSQWMLARMERVVRS
ncbi:MAG: Mut7-C RNAse domain-containing protein [Thermoanaerobaculales bacterium]